MDKRPLVLLVIEFILIIGPVHGKEDASNFDDLADSAFVRTGKPSHLSCFPPNQTIEDPGSFKHAAFTWKDRKNHTVTDSRFLVQNNGNLEVADSQPRDSGAYYCEAMHRGNVHTTKHHLIVYKLADYYYESVLEYQLPDCAKSTIGYQQQEIFLFICAVGNCMFTATTKCRQKTNGNSLVEYTIRLNPPSDIQQSECKKLSCIQDQVTNAMQQAYKPLEKFIDQELEASALVSDPDDPKLVDFTKKGINCSAGYRLFGDILCLPCPPGTYSRPGDTKCSKCEADKYQTQYASAGCDKCPEGQVTHRTGANSVLECIKKDVVEVNVGGLRLEIDKGLLTKKTNGVPVGAVVGGIVPVLIIAMCVGCCCVIKKKFFKSLQAEGFKSTKMAGEARMTANTQYMDGGEFGDDDEIQAKQSSEVASLLEEGIPGSPIKQSTMRRTVKKVTKTVQSTKAGAAVTKQINKFTKGKRASDKVQLREGERVRRPRDPRKSEYDPQSRYIETDDTAYNDTRFSNQWSARMANDVSNAFYKTFAQEDNSTESEESDDDDDDVIYFDFGILLPFADELNRMLDASASVPSMQEETLQDGWNTVMSSNNPRVNMNSLLLPKPEVFGGLTGSQIGNEMYDETVDMTDVLEEFGEGQGEKPPILRRADTAVFSDLAISKQSKLTKKGPDEIMNRSNLRPSTTSTAVFSDMPWMIGTDKAYMSPELEMRKSQASTAILSDTELSPTRGKIKGSLSNKRVGVVFKTSQLISFRPKLGAGFI